MAELYIAALAAASAAISALLIAVGLMINGKGDDWE